MKKAGSCALGSHEPRQARKGATVSGFSRCCRVVWLESPIPIPLGREVDGEVHGHLS